MFGSGLSLAGLAKKFSSRNVIACGKLQDPEAAEKLLADGEADFAAMAKGALADPTWPLRVAAAAISMTNLEALVITLISPTWRADVTSAWHAWRDRNAFN